MAKIKFDRFFLIVFLLLGGILVVYFLAVVSPYIKKQREISAEIKRKTKELEAFREEKGGVSSLELMKSLENAQTDCRRETTFLKEYLGGFDTDIPSAISQKGLFFKKRAYQSERRLREKAEAKGIILPAVLGFDKGVPKDEEAQRRLWELAAIEKLVESLIESEIDSLVLLKLQTSQEHNQAGIVYINTPIEIEYRCKTVSLLKFLHSLSQAHSPLIIAKMDVEKKPQRQNDKELLDVNLTVEGIRMK